MKINPSTSLRINPSIFRKYDIRGIYPQDINEKVAFQIASAFAKIYPELKKIVVAHDSRLSSPSLAKAVREALVRQGIEVIDIALAPDSLFYFSIFHYKFDGGIMITASHNPPQYNGFILNIRGFEVIEEGLEKIKEAASKSYEVGPRKLKGRVTSFSPEKDYIQYVTKEIHLKKPLKIVFDSGNGAVSFLPEKVFKKLECETKTLFGEPDGAFPHHLPDPYLEENLKDIKGEVLKEGADLGFAFDGDGDRVVLIDNKGRRVLEDYCLLMLAKEALKKEKGPVVHDVRISQVFLEEVKQCGAKTYFSVCHHNAVIEKIKEVGAVFGGEVTSHYLFPKDYYLADDAVFSALKLAEIASQYGDFSRYVDSLPKIYVSKEIFVDVPDEEKFSIIEKLKNYLRENNFNFIDVDGARIEFEKGWALARASNTSPLIKLRFEGETPKDLKEIKSQASKVFSRCGIKIKP